TLVWGDSRLIATIGLRNLIIVDTPDALLVCAQDSHQDVKKIVEQLKRAQSRKHV
ncbi:MAG: mannose-1-phosphate guanylyltransferase/mannose-6-phosphate isomerase, partial [Candidatus Omnitrophica bacterium]|nr:mannose-1-phosphate guanylyltransferase/mannose-6-phosphate isomerase [Candidatus Omnitrophota bacterium]